MIGRTCKFGSAHGTRMRCLDVEKFEFQVSGGRLWASFWEAFGDPGVTLSGFFRVPERGWTLDGHLGDQTWILVDF